MPTSYEDVKHVTDEEYFIGNKFSIDAFGKKYSLDGKETYVQMLKRVCDAVASVEEKESLYWSQRWFDEIYNDWWHFAGSIAQGAGSGKKISLSNCTTVNGGMFGNEEEWDNLESIIKVMAYNVAKYAAYRQGLGLDFSQLRPVGTEILNSAKVSTGAIHWMKYIDSIGYYVGQSGRIPALLFSLSINHPDIEEFITVKSDYTKIQNANISVQITDAFYDAVEQDKDWVMTFIVPEVVKGQEVYVNKNVVDDSGKYFQNEYGWYYIATHDVPRKEIKKTAKARKLFRMIAENMWRNAEPGIQNIDTARRYSNSDYVYDPKSDYDSRIVSTNACCVDGDTEILTSTGFHKIASLENQFVSVWNGEEFSTVEILETNQNQKMLEISFSNGKKVRCTEYHKFPIVENENWNFILAKYLQIDDKLIEYSLPSGEVCKDIKVTGIKEAGIADKVYCFNEPKRHMGIFNGVITGQSEQYLSPDSCCVLGSINMGRFTPENYEKDLKKISESIVRFLDNVNTLEIVGQTYATENQRRAMEQLRRIGAGVTNIGAWLFSGGYAYGDKEGNAKLEEFMGLYNEYMYRASVQLGLEKGSFGLFNREKFEQSLFVKRMMERGVEFPAMRNVTCSSIAPTGTLSLMFRNTVFSYGGEPPFGLYFWKRTRISGKYEYYFVVPHIVRKVFATYGHKIPIQSDTIKDTWDGAKGKPIAEFIDKHLPLINTKFKAAKDVTAMEKLELMAGVSKHVDSSISITYMLPETTAIEEVEEFILSAHKFGVKSIAAFPDKKMYGIVSSIPFRELAVNLTKEGVNIHEQNFTQEELDYLVSLGISIVDEDNTDIDQRKAPKRPKSLPCDIHTVKSNYEDMFVLVGLLNGKPYEVFSGSNQGNLITRYQKHGAINKKKRGQYELTVKDKVVIANIAKTLNEDQEAITRLVSTNLRHGTDIEFLVHQLEKVPGSMFSYAKVLARVLKKYIQDGTTVTGATCPVCSSENLSREEGCVKCNDCGNSKCS